MSAAGIGAAGRERDPLRHHVVVLNVDDYEAGRYATSRVLRQAGFDVREAASGEEALHLVGEHPDLVLLDVNLPDVDGFEVCRRIKADPRTAAIPVLYLSAAYRTPEHRVQGLDLGADGYLTQPVEPRELVATVNALLRAREVEEAVRASESRFRTLVAATSDIVWTTAPDGTVDRDQPSWTAFTGQEPAAVRGWGWLEAVHPEDRERVRADWMRALEARGVYRTEMRLRRRDGEYRHMAVFGVPLLDAGGAVREWVGTHADLTERHRAEQWQRLFGEAAMALAGSMEVEAALPRVVELAVESLAAWAAVDLLEEDGTLRHAASAVRAAAHAGVAETMDRAAHEGGDACAAVVAGTGRTEFVRDVDASGTDAAAAMRAAGVRSFACVPLTARGQVLGTLTLAATEGQPRYTETDVARMEELGRRIALAVDNARLYRQAVKANAVKGEFLAVMSHELRTPLNAIIGYADLLDAAVSGDLNAAQREQLGRIKIGARHLLRLIEEVLLFSRVEAGREEVVREEVDLAALAREAAALVEPLAREKGLRFRVELPPDGLRLSTDPGKVHQIVLNLLSNAVKFTDTGEVAVELRADAGDALLRVRDTGIGIGVDDQERIWDAFSQVVQAPTRRAGGTGLGLSVTRNLARLLGGDVTVQSAFGSGSTFTLRLPLAPPAA